MLIQFEERLDLPVEHVYPYFKSPRDWPRLYGSFGDAEDRGDGWYAVPLKGFPFPLVCDRVGDGECHRRAPATRTTEDIRPRIPERIGKRTVLGRAFGRHRLHRVEANIRHRIGRRRATRS